MRRAFPLAAALLVGCTSAVPGPDEPPPRQVRRELAQLLEGTEHLQLTEFRNEGEGRYAAEAKAPDGTSYHVDVTVRGRTLSYEASGGGLVLHAQGRLPEPSFEDRHPQVLQWLRGLALVVQTAGAIWPALGRFGLRRRFAPRTETILAVFAAVNAGFAAWWVYQIILNWGVA